MKSKSFVALVVLLVSGLSLAATQTTITGILTDDMCTRKHMMSGKTNADCVRDCVKHGAKYVVAVEGKPTLLVGERAQMDELAGKKVNVTGEMKGKALAISSMESAH